MKYLKYDHKEIEEELLDFWKKEKVVQKLREKNVDGPKFYFLDGPPYTSGKFHLAHAWNYSLKDFVLRYKRMRGYNVWDRNGFDMHGLPTAHKVMAKHKLETKEDIEKFGVDKFINECIDFSKEMADVMTKDLVRMGVTFDVSNPYMPVKNEFIEGEWQLIKNAYDKGRVYYGEKVLTWCQNCETALAKHECEYENVTDKSIFVKFPIKGKDNEFLIIWTTTPWTIPYNLAVMVGPEIDYVKAEITDPENESAPKEKWVLAKALAGIVVSSVANKKMKVVEEFKGEALEGLEYVHPFADDIKKYAELKKEQKNVHTVILSAEHVDTTAGTGLVHSAPGCGPEDQDACKPYGILAFNELSEDGYFSDVMGKFKGWRAKVDDPKFIEAIDEKGLLVAKTNVAHEYPHCWRCKNPVVFRTTNQWFFKVEDIKKRIVEENKDVNWVPDTALNSYESWVGNLKDNSISRQRYWGTPLPIWNCECGEVKVIGSRKDIEELGGKVPENLHRPWIDNVELDCPKCKAKMKRIPDIIDVWVDAGSASWNCLNNDPKLIKEWFPADMILEAKEQTRLWFSMLSIVSYLHFDTKAFKNVYVYGMLNDIEGKKMSKSIGNIISPYELIDKHGVDVLRYYMCQNNAGQDINFSWDECKNKSRYLQILWNVHKLLINLAKENKVNPFELDSDINHNIMALEEKYIVSKLHSTIKKVTELFDKHMLDETIAPLEELYLELSRTYIQMVRDKSALGEDHEKELVMFTIGHVLFEFLKMFNVVAPFISEAIYQNFKDEFKLKKKSISHYQWPTFDESKIDVSLEAEMEVAKQIIQGSLNAREKAKLGLRWPVKEVAVVSRNETVVMAVEKLRDIIKRQVNAKDISVLESLPGVKTKIKPVYGKIGPVYADFSTSVITQLTVDSPETVLGHLERENVYEFTLEGREVKITRDMVEVEREVPESYKESELKNALVYLSVERNDELDAEGYAREIMRHVQQLRKQAGLEKLDEIMLFLKVEDGLDLSKHKLDIQEKVNIEKMEISSTLKPVRKHEVHEEIKVKGKVFEVWFSKI